jgi:hypothetical protein
MAGVLQDWVSELPLMQQSTLITALRGVDGVGKENPSKKLTRALRSIVCVDAQPDTEHSFMNISNLISTKDLKDFLEDIDPYPIHFVLHLLFAIEIVGYKHPDRKVRGFYLAAYERIVYALHLNPETEDQLNQRLNK